MIVLDSNAAVEIVRNTPKGQALAQLMLSGELVLSSQLYCSEVCEILQKYAREGLIDDKIACDYVEKALRLVDRFFEPEKYYREVLHESLRLDHPSYRLFYFCLARHENATLFTMDKRLAALAEREGVDCVQEVAF